MDKGRLSLQKENESETVFKSRSDTYLEATLLNK